MLLKVGIHNFIDFKIKSILIGKELKKKLLHSKRTIVIL